MSYACVKVKYQQPKLYNKAKYYLEKLGGEDATFDEMLAATKYFFLLMYGPNNQMTVSEARYQLFKKNSKPPPLKKLPPIEENMKLYPPTS